MSSYTVSWDGCDDCWVGCGVAVGEGWAVTLVEVAVGGKDVSVVVGGMDVDVAVNAIMVGVDGTDVLVG